MADSKVNQDAPQKITDYINKVDGEFHNILTRLREIIMSSDLGIIEDWKWNAPNFHQEGMVCWLASFKQHVGLNFFKGSLIEDKHHLFESCGDGKSNRMIKYSKLSQIEETHLKYYLQKAVELNQKGVKVETKKINTNCPEDFQNALDNHEKAKEFFNSLAPSYQRDYIEWITSAKQEATREKRLLTSIEWLSEGKKKNWKYEKC